MLAGTSTARPLLITPPATPPESCPGPLPSPGCIGLPQLLGLLARVPYLGTRLVNAPLRVGHLRDQSVSQGSGDIRSLVRRICPAFSGLGAPLSLFRATISRAELIPQNDQGVLQQG